MYKKIIFIGKYKPTKLKSFRSPEDKRFYTSRWVHLLAYRLKAKYPNLKIEIWRPEDISSSLFVEFIDNIKYKIYPIKYGLISNKITFSMIKDLSSKKNRDSIIFYTGAFDFKFLLINMLFFKSNRIIMEHRGGIPPSGNGIKNKLKRSFLLLGYKEIDAFIYRRSEIKDFVNKTSKPPRFYFNVTGTDFNIFQPINKSLARKKLGLDQYKVYSITVGPFSKTKNADLVLKYQKQLKELNYNYENIFVGGKVSNDLFDLVKYSGNPYFMVQHQSELKYFYSAADFYLHPLFNFKRVGFDNALIEAMACGIPVISTQLKELDFDYSDLGLLINKEEEIPEMIIKMIHNFQNYKSTCELAFQHFEKNLITKRYYEIIMGKI